MLDAVRGYTQLAMGLTEMVVRQLAEQAAPLIADGLARVGLDPETLEKARLDRVGDVVGKAAGAAGAAAGAGAGLATDLAGKAAHAGQAGIRKVPGVAQTPDDLGQKVQGVAEDLLSGSKANRELLVGLIRTEIDRAVGRMGFVREEELAAVRRHVARLEAQLAAAEAHDRTPTPADLPSEPLFGEGVNRPGAFPDSPPDTPSGERPDVPSDAQHD